MSAIRFSVLKSVYTSISPRLRTQSCRSYNYCMKIWKFADLIDPRPSLTCLNRNYHTKQSGSTQSNSHNGFGVMGMEVPVVNHYHRTSQFTKFSPALSNLHPQRYISLSGVSPMLSYRLYSSGSQGNDPRGSDWVEKAKDVWQSTVDGVTYTGQKAKEASAELTPHVQQLLDTHPYLRDVIVPISCTLTATVLAWVVMPRILRRFHRYSTQGSAALLSDSILWGPVPYEKSFWGALEDPLRYLITFMAFSQIGMMVAPSTIASQYIAAAWRGAFVLSFVWFLNRWKTNVFSRTLASKSLAGIDRERLLTLDKLSSVGLFVLGLMALAEACGVAVQSILTVGGIGGVATAFAARDVLGNVLSGLSVQFSRPFSIGDTIKAGSVEGQVVEMGLTTTSLLTAEKFPAIVPNSLFSSQVITNKSRAQWRAFITKIPLQIGDFDKIPQISDDIKSMLASNLNVFMEKEAPYCFLSRIERSFAELTLGCNLRHMRKDELFSAQQDILLQAVQIIKKHGATLGSAFDDMTSQ